MKKIRIILALLAITIVSCEKADIRPDYMKGETQVFRNSDTGSDEIFTRTNKDDIDNKSLTTSINLNNEKGNLDTETIVDPNNDEDENTFIGGGTIVVENPDADKHSYVLINLGKN